MLHWLNARLTAQLPPFARPDHPALRYLLNREQRRTWGNRPGARLVLAIAFLLALCGAFAVTRDRVLQSRLLATGLSFGLALGASIALQTPLAGLIVIVLAIMMLAGFLVQEA